MSPKTDYTTEIEINRSVDDIRAVLTDLERLPSWNPAFSHVGPRRDDGSHPLTVQSFLNGSISATSSKSRDGGACTVDFDIAIPGLRERSSFLLEPQSDEKTRVTHRVQQAGALSFVIGPREAALVPGKRLDRLSRVLGGIS